jgi:hypothetical protein
MGEIPLKVHGDAPKSLPRGDFQLSEEGLLSFLSKWVIWPQPC